MTAPPSSENQPRAPRRVMVWALVGIALAVGVCWLVFSAQSNRTGAGNGWGDDPPNVPAGPPWFQDVTPGLDFTYRNGEEADQYTILETLGGGVALIDYDGDGLLDVFLTGGGTFDGGVIKGRPCRLYKNLGGWKFRDVTAEVGLDRVDWWYTHGAAVVDFDRDGRPDLLITGYGRIALFRNVDGKRFVDVTADVGLKDERWATSAGWADLDGDGWPDLYVCHYADWSFANDLRCPGQRPGVKRDNCPPQRFKPLAHSVFRNEKGKRFHDESSRLGLKPAGYGLGVVLLDVNGDGKPDVYVGNDASNNLLYVNRSAGGRLSLEEKGLEAGVAVNESGQYDGSMGVDAGDYDGSGRASLWVANFQGDLHALYANTGSGRFEHRSRAAGIGALGQHWVGFGTALVDVDNDGWLDIVIANGHVQRFPVGTTAKQRPILMWNVEYRGRRFFVDASARGGDVFKTPGMGRGLAVGDLDNDGWPDVVISHTNSPVSLLRNAGGANRWLGISLKGRDHRDVVGSTVVVELADGRKLTRFAKGGGSYLSSGNRRLLFGLGEVDKVKAITVRWSWGKEETWDGGKFGPGRYYELHEGKADPVPHTEQRN